MRKILLTCGKMSVGGIQKALLSFANELHQNGYDVTVLLDDLSGELTAQFSDGIHVQLLENGARTIHMISLSDKKQLLRYSLQKPLFGISALKCYFHKKNRISNRDIAQILWKYFSMRVVPYQEEFDYAISFAGLMGVWNEYIIDKVNANRKICWIHGNYETTGIKSENEIYYLNRFDDIITVTETNTKLVRKYVSNPQRVNTIHNTMNIDLILRKSKEKIPIIKKYFTFVTMSRLNYGKGIEQGLDAASILKKRGVLFDWYIMGDGPLKEEFIAKSYELGLDKQVHFLGNVSNPYPYLALSDIYFHPSLGEGRSIAIDEAKILCKPVVATNYTTVYDQIHDGVNGLIVKPIPEFLANGIEKMASSVDLLYFMKTNLAESRIQYYDFNIYKSFIALMKKSQWEMK